jgi:hypothetical protein
LPELPLPLVAAHRVLPCRFSVDEEEPAEAPRTLLVWRRGVEVFHRPLAADEEALLGRAGTFGAVCEQLAATQAADEAAARGFALLARWLSDELIVKV